MPTDTDRREVARRLREHRGAMLFNGGDIEYFMGVPASDFCPSKADESYNRLADLIEPALTSSDKAPTDCDPTVRGIDSIYDWCFERIEGADGAEDELYCTIMRAIEDYRHPELATAHTVRAVDRDALLALANEIEDNDVTYSVSTQYVLDDYARRIREALEVES